MKVIDGKFSLIEEISGKSYMTVNNYHLLPIVEPESKHGTRTRKQPTTPLSATVPITSDQVNYDTSKSVPMNASPPKYNSANTKNDLKAIVLGQDPSMRTSNNNSPSKQPKVTKKRKLEFAVPATGAALNSVHLTSSLVGGPIPTAASPDPIILPVKKKRKRRKKAQIEAERAEKAAKAAAAAAVKNSIIPATGPSVEATSQPPPT